MDTEPSSPPGKVQIASEAVNDVSIDDGPSIYQRRNGQSEDGAKRQSINEKEVNGVGEVDERDVRKKQVPSSLSVLFRPPIDPTTGLPWQIPLLVRDPYSLSTSST